MIHVLGKKNEYEKMYTEEMSKSQSCVRDELTYRPIRVGAPIEEGMRMLKIFE